MECTSHKSIIEETFSNIRTFSYDEKRSSAIDEHKINTFLDRLLDFKKSLNQKTEKINSLSNRMADFTWFNDLDEECLMQLNDLISATKDLRTSLIRQYVAMNNTFVKRGVAKEEINNFKEAIDNLKEAYEDLESTFFFLPAIPDFVETTKQLSLIK
jgi:uncharacterized protein (UPF0305 family)